jgi:hypothetical protein
MQKPTKPTPDFPLFPHASGQWAKKIAGKLRYFGKWDNPQDALRRYNGESVQHGRRLISLQPKTLAVKPLKPPKPYKDFPLYAHASGRWAKKVRGETLFFGPWDDHKAALEKWLAEKDALLAGRVPKITGDGLTVESLINQFLNSKESFVKTGELTERTLEYYHRIAKQIAHVFGKQRLVPQITIDGT